MREPEYRGAQRRYRPFSASAEVSCRGCSQPLQRAVVDFGADHAFAQVADKLQEHYGIELPVSTIRRLTEDHAQRLAQRQELAERWPSTLGCAALVVEMDGSMIPVVHIDEQASDRRQGKVHAWKEARLSMARDVEKITPQFGATLGGTVEQAGQQLFDCACRAGLGHQTYVHALGDGAVWIADQVDQWFGAQGHYLVDFYHVCEYLGAAANSEIGAAEPQLWLEQHKALLKAGQVSTVIEHLAPYREPDAVDEAQAPVRACHRYLSNRMERFDYPAAQARGLPVGSGEIESAHRYVIQARLKRPGAWWKPIHAQHMLALRVVRANGEWENYWQELREAA